LLGVRQANRGVKKKKNGWGGKRNYLKGGRGGGPMLEKKTRHTPQDMGQVVNKLGL